MGKNFRRTVLAVIFCLVLGAGTAACGKKETAVPEPTPTQTPFPTAVTDSVAHLAEVIATAYRDTPEQASAIAADAVKKMESIDPEQAAQWSKVTRYWDYTRDGLAVNTDGLPDTLPKDNSFCIVVLGFELNPDGTMKDELVGRLETAMQCARQYPNAYVLCTGGGTASDNPEATEAGEMSRWLQSEGLSSERLLVEDRSLSTAENARFSYELLKEQAPSVTGIALVTSSYHIAWGALLFETELIHIGTEGDLKILSNAAYECDSGQYTPSVVRYLESAGVLFIMQTPEG